jgi:short-subunit dehydrogenase
MEHHAAIVTGASRGIGLALARVLGEQGYQMTICARKEDGLARVADQLRGEGVEADHFAANLTDEEAIKDLVQHHRERFGRLDVLVNSAGVGVGAAATEHRTKFVDMQYEVNVRSIILFYRECLDLLKTAGREHGNAWVVNVASLAGKSPQPWLSVYSATKAAVLAYTVAMNREFAEDGVKSVAFAGFVDTDMSDWVKLRRLSRLRRCSGQRT